MSKELVPMHGVWTISNWYHHVLLRSVDIIRCNSTSVLFHNLYCVTFPSWHTVLVQYCAIFETMFAL